MNRRTLLKNSCLGSLGAATAVACGFGGLSLRHARGDMVARTEGIDLGLPGLPPLVEPGAYILLGRMKSGRTRLMRYFAEHCNARRYEFMDLGGYHHLLNNAEFSLRGRDQVGFMDFSVLCYGDFDYFDGLAKKHDTFIVAATVNTRADGHLVYPDRDDYWEIDQGFLSFKDRNGKGRLLDVRHITTRKYGVRDED